MKVANSLRYLKAAFLLPSNLVALACATIASLASGEPLALAIVMGVESLYLGLVSTATPFRRAMRAKLNAQIATEEQEEIPALLEALGPSQREHYFALKELRNKILENYQKLPGGRVLVAASEPRVTALLTSFLRLLFTLNSYRKYLNAADRRNLERELKDLIAEEAGEENPRIKNVKQKRIEILKQRVERFHQAEESREIVSHQLAGIEDILRLTHEQSIAIRDPESVGRQLEALTAEVRSTQETVREMEKFLELGDAVDPTVSQGVRVR
jgi:hypothetical protein